MTKASGALRKRWNIERTNACLQNFRYIQVRYDRILTSFRASPAVAAPSLP
jgi:transposase